MNRFSWRRGRGEDGFDELVRRNRPEPSDEFLRSYADRFRSEGTRTGLGRLLVPRLAAAAAVTALAVVGMALAGGFGTARSGVLGAYHEVAQAVNGGTTTTAASSSPSSTQYKPGKGCGDTNHDHQPKPGTGSADPTKPCPVQAFPKSQAEGRSGTSTMSVPVAIVGFTPVSPLTVAYKTIALSATAGNDYQSVSGTLSFAAGETAKSILVPIIGDTTKEPDEYFAVVLYNPSPNATVIGSYANIAGATYGKIVNDD